MHSYTKLDANCINKELLVSLCREYSALGKSEVVYTNSNGDQALYVGHTDVLRGLDELKYVEFGCEDSVSQLKDVWKISGAVDAMVFVSIINLRPDSRCELLDSYILIHTDLQNVDVSSGRLQKGIEILKFFAFSSVFIALMSSAVVYRTLTGPRSEDEPASKTQLEAQELRASIAELEKLEEFESLSIDITPKTNGISLEKTMDM